jgi:hypothetical protein
VEAEMKTEIETEVETVMETVVETEVETEVKTEVETKMEPGTEGRETEGPESEAFDTDVIGDAGIEVAAAQCK